MPAVTDIVQCQGELTQHVKQALAYSINFPEGIIGQCKECSIDDTIYLFFMKVYHSKYNTL